MRTERRPLSRNGILRVERINLFGVGWDLRLLTSGATDELRECQQEHRLDALLDNWIEVPEDAVLHTRMSQSWSSKSQQSRSECKLMRSTNTSQPPGYGGGYYGRSC